MAALPATAVWEVRATGSDTQCSGAFNSARGGTDYSQQNAAQATGTVTSSTTTVTATTAIFTSAMVGNTITDGTITKEITAFTSTTVVTVDSAPAWTAATIYVGGALATPGKALSAAVGGNTIYATGSFSVTSASFNVAGGCVNPPAGPSPSAATRLIGYGATRGDNLKATLTASGIGTFTLCKGSGNVLFYNITADAAGLTAGRCFDSNATACAFVSCAGKNATNNAFVGLSSAWAVACEATGCSSTAFSALDCTLCVAHDNTAIGFLLGSGIVVTNSVAANNTGATSDGFSINASSVGMIGCLAYGNGRHGFSVASSTNSQMQIINCIAAKNVSKGFTSASTNDGLWLLNCAVWSNGTDVDTTVPSANRIGLVTLTADPFLAAASNDFRLNAVSGGGAALKALSFPASLPGLSTPNLRDIGPTQHVDAAPSGGAIRIGT